MGARIYFYDKTDNEIFESEAQLKLYHERYPQTAGNEIICLQEVEKPKNENDQVEDWHEYAGPLYGGKL